MTSHIMAALAGATVAGIAVHAAWAWLENLRRADGDQMDDARDLAMSQLARENFSLRQRIEALTALSQLPRDRTADQ